MARLVLFLVACLLAQAFCVPAGNRRQDDKRRPLRDNSDADNEAAQASPTNDTDDDDDEDFGETMETASSNGSNILSLLNLATALFPSSSASSHKFAQGSQYKILDKFESMIRRVIREYFIRNPVQLRRQDIADNVIEIDYINKLTPPFQHQEDENESDDNDSNGIDTNESDSHDDSNDDDDDDKSSSEEDNAAEESVEENNINNDKASKQDSGLNEDSNDSDYSDEPPGGDGNGGGVLGLLAGLSGGEDGSDLGSLLAAVSGIVANLSGDGFDLNALIATGFGLFVGLLSEGEENPGAVIASYLLTSLDTITGGGSKNNGAFIGTFLSKLIKGTSAVSEESGSSEDAEGGKMPMSDSTGFFVSLLMSLSGDMSKGSSGGSSAWR